VAGADGPDGAGGVAVDGGDRPAQSVRAQNAASQTTAPKTGRQVGPRVDQTGGAGDDRQIARAFARTLQRTPSAEDNTACRTFFNTQPLVALCRGLLNLNEFV
jgi:hypothetical protein